MTEIEYVVQAFIKNKFSEEVLNSQGNDNENKTIKEIKNGGGFGEDFNLLDREKVSQMVNFVIKQDFTVFPVSVNERFPFFPDEERNKPFFMLPSDSIEYVLTKLLSENFSE